LITIANLNFSFTTHDVFSSKRNRVIFRDFSFVFEIGKIYWIKGDNGVGKSTLLNIISGLIPLFDDSVTNVNNYTIGLFRNNYGLIESLKSIDFLKTYHKFYSEELFIELVKGLGFEIYLETKIKHLSGGNKAKLLLINLLLLDSEFVLLDEPFQALDTKSVDFAKTIFQRLTETGTKTIILVNHDKNKPFECCEELELVHF
jgi:ABC-type multidrug transport system ATPase subunit